MAKFITHRGIVKNINGSIIQVRIVQTSACSSCSARGHCTSAEQKEKIIDIYSTAASNYRIGDSVTIIGEMSMGFKAVLWAFFLPFLLLVLSLFVCMHISGGNELISGFISLSILIPYYIVIWCLRNQLKKQLSFSIKSN